MWIAYNTYYYFKDTIMIKKSSIRSLLSSFVEKLFQKKNIKKATLAI